MAQVQFEYFGHARFDEDESPFIVYVPKGLGRVGVGVEDRAAPKEVDRKGVAGTVVGG